MFTSCARVLKSLGKPIAAGLVTGFGACTGYMIAMTNKLECTYLERHLPKLPDNITFPIENITQAICNFNWTSARDCLFDCYNRAIEVELRDQAKTYGKNEPTVTYVLIMAGAVLTFVIGKCAYQLYIDYKESKNNQTTDLAQGPITIITTDLNESKPNILSEPLLPTKESTGLEIAPEVRRFGLR